MMYRQPSFFSSVLARLLFVWVVLGATQSVAAQEAVRRAGVAGNRDFSDGAFEQAKNKFERGLSEASRLEDGSVWTDRLRYNLGASLYEAESYEDALSAFSEVDALDTADLRANARYNAGNAAYRAGDLQRAADLYRSVLREDPTRIDARQNYEFVTRQLQAQQDPSASDQPQDGERNQDQSQGGDQDQAGDQEDQQDPSAGNEGDEGQESTDDPQDSDSESPSGEQQEQESPNGDPSQPGEEQESEAQPPRFDPNQLSREEAERMLEALQQEEGKLLREIQKPNLRARRVEKDW